MGTVVAQPTESSDRTLAIVGGASIAVSVGAVLARFAGVLPDGLATIVAIVGVAIALKVAFSYAAKTASSSARTRMMTMISTVALSISALTAVASLPRITGTAGLNPFIMDLLAQLWTLALLAIVVSPVRTLGWRAFVGTGLTGFLALTALARLVGRPFVEKLGTSSIVATALVVPFSEELLKLIPVGVVVAMALRRTNARPSLLEVTLLGAASGAGFALYESASLGRGLFSLTANPLFSLFFPSEVHAGALGWTIVQTGHLVHTALITLGVAFALFYPRQVARRWIVPTVAVVSVLVEHCSQNAIVTGHLNSFVAQLSIILTLGGRLTSLELIGGVAYVARLEWRAVDGSLRPGFWRGLESSEAQRRATLLATAQTAGAL